MITRITPIRSVVLFVLPLLMHLHLGIALAGDSPPAAPEEPVAASEAGPARPSHPGGTGGAVNLVGDADNGAVLFKANCESCHGPEGKDNVPNPGSTDGTFPPLNPVDPAIAGKSGSEFVANTDLYLEHGSRPEGPNPEKEMPAWGDSKALEPQQIADLIAFMMRLNK
jgi:mono/diheme cytochrome c family protein